MRWINYKMRRRMMEKKKKNVLGMPYVHIPKWRLKRGPINYFRIQKIRKRKKDTRAGICMKLKHGEIIV